MSATQEKTQLKEIRELKAILEHIEALLEERLIGEDKPLPDELKAAKQHEKGKREKDDSNSSA